MDATRLRELITGALEAQRVLDAADAAEVDARTARASARERHIAECGNLKAAIADGFVIFGESVLRVGNSTDGIRLYSHPLVNVPVVAPPPAPLPEADPPEPAKTTHPLPSAPFRTTEASKPAAPLSGGKVPDAAKKSAPASGK